jgi:hypothetical protein
LKSHADGSSENLGWADLPLKTGDTISLTVVVGAPRTEISPRREASDAAAKGPSSPLNASASGLQLTVLAADNMEE